MVQSLHHRLSANWRWMLDEKTFIKSQTIRDHRQLTVTFKKFLAKGVLFKYNFIIVIKS
jgi:hypothetical protein